MLRLYAMVKDSDSTDTPRPPHSTGEDRLPGDPEPAELVARFLRVDQAGEFGAARIYAGQLAVLGRSTSGPVIRAMAEAEQKHLAEINRLMIARRVRPTALSPLWNLAGFALGLGSALLGERAAMACTVAVEEVIEGHYAGQVAKLGEDEAAVRARLEEFGADETKHKETALAHGAQQTPGYQTLSRAVRAGTRLAIWLSERI
jgi:ubiquinone biosynthesis monooxygenase Coq7